jgi:hypothetical protein
LPRKNSASTFLNPCPSRWVSAAIGQNRGHEKQSNNLPDQQFDQARGDDHLNPPAAATPISNVSQYVTDDDIADDCRCAWDKIRRGASCPLACAHAPMGHDPRVLV